MTATMPSSETLAKSTGSCQCEISIMLFVTASNGEIGRKHKPESCDYTNHTRDALGHQKNDPPVTLPPRRASRAGFPRHSPHPLGLSLHLVRFPAARVS